MEARNLLRRISLLTLLFVGTIANAQPAKVPFSDLPIATSVNATNDRIVYLSWTGTGYTNKIIAPNYLVQLGLTWADTLSRRKSLATNFFVDSLFALTAHSFTLTTTGTSGAATYIGNVLNIPNYGNSAWSLTGNTGTNPNLNWLGTNDDQILRFKQNGNTAGWIDGDADITAFGAFAGNYGSTTATDNTSLGYGSGTALTSGTSNTFVGSSNGVAVKNGSNNILLGYNNSTTAINTSNCLGIGNNLTISSGQIMLGNGQTYFNLCGGTLASSSNIGNLYINPSTGVITVGLQGGSGTVTSVATGFGLLGGTITTTGTLKVDTAHNKKGVASTYIADSIGNVKQNTLTLTTTGTSGAATLSGATLNIPQYAGTTYSAGTGLTLTGSAFSLTSPVTSILGGTGTTTSFGKTSIPFVQGGSGVYTQDNLYFAYSKIGGHKFSVTNDADTTGSDLINLVNGQLDVNQAGSGTLPTNGGISFSEEQGTSLAPTKSTANDTISGVQYWPYNGVSWVPTDMQYAIVGKAEGARPPLQMHWAFRNAASAAWVDYMYHDTSGNMIFPKTLAIGSGTPTSNVAIEGAISSNATTYGFQFINSNGGASAVAAGYVGNGTNTLQLSINGTGAASSGAALISNGNTTLTIASSGGTSSRLNLTCNGTSNISADGTVVNVGFGANGVTRNGMLNIAAGTASDVSIYLVPSVLATTPVPGGIENNLFNLYYTPVGTTRREIPLTGFTGNQSVTVANTTTPTSLVGTGVGSMAMPSSSQVAGKTMHLHLAGIISTGALTNGITFTILYGGTTFASDVISTGGLVSLSSNAYNVDVYIQLQSITSNVGTFVVSGRGDVTTSVTSGLSTSANFDLNNGGATVTKATNASETLDFQVTWATASANNTITNNIVTMEILN